MIKKFTINKIIVTSLSLTLLLMFYFFPSTSNIKTEVINEESENKKIVYLLDSDNYVSQVITYFDSKTINDEIKSRINILINGDDSLNNFYNLIPKSTKVLDVSVKDNIATINFSKDILEVNKYLEESMIEAIIYSLTEINGITGVIINVEGKELTSLPNSKKKLIYPLNRSYGINKNYDLVNLNNMSKTTIYFNKENDDYEYYVPVTKISNTSSEKINIIIEELKSIIYAQENLNSYLSSKAILKSFNTEDNKMYLVFNDYIFSDLENASILEEVKYTIAESIFDNYNVDKVIFSTEEKKNIATISK